MAAAAILNCENGCHFFTIWPIIAKFSRNIANLISKNDCHFFTIWLIVTKISGNIRTSIWNISIIAEMHSCKISVYRSPSWISKNDRHFFTIWEKSSNYNSKWRPPPSWILKICCNFFTIWPIVTKISGNIGTSIWNISITSEIHSCKKSSWQLPPSWISKIGCHFFTIWLWLVICIFYVKGIYISLI